MTRLQHLARLLALFSLCTLCMGAAPPEDEQAAAKLHDRAIRSYEKGETSVAIEHWREAERLHPHWKYAFNLASALTRTEQWLDAWQAFERLTSYAPPARFAGKVAELRALVRGNLLRTHAHIALSVEPEGAEVTRNSEPWKGPRAAWTTDEMSRLRVTHPGYVALERTWSHPKGGNRTLQLRLKKKPKKQSMH